MEFAEGKCTDLHQNEEESHHDQELFVASEDEEISRKALKKSLRSFQRMACGIY